MPKKGEYIIKFANCGKQMKFPCVMYADFESLITLTDTCLPNPDASSTEKTSEHVPCGFAYTVVCADGEIQGALLYRGEDAMQVFLRCVQETECRIRGRLSEKKPLEITREYWASYEEAKDCHICGEQLIKYKRSKKKRAQ